MEIIKFILYSVLIVIISKYALVKILRKLAQSFNFRSKTVGNIAGYATSIPELLTVSMSSFNGLIGTSIYNVISSNIIILIQYVISVILNKNHKVLKNKAIIIDIILVIITIIIPIMLIIFNIDIDTKIVPAFIVLYCLFILLNNQSHNTYIAKPNDKEIPVNLQDKNKVKIIKYSMYLLLTGILLFVIGDRLGKTLEVLCNNFNIPQMVIGILLGIITSIPELITFIESQKHHKNSISNISGIVEATNNLLTSNILNLFVIQSIGILIYTFV